MVVPVRDRLRSKAVRGLYVRAASLRPHGAPVKSLAVRDPDRVSRGRSPPLGTVAAGQGPVGFGPQERGIALILDAYEIL